MTVDNEPLPRASFVFVTSNGPRIPKDDDIRESIRRQAMSRVRSSRQQNVERQKRKLGEQCIAIMARQGDGRDGCSSEPQAMATELNGAGVVRVSDNMLELSKGQTESPATLRSTLSSTGYERLRTEYKFDVLDLSGFTTIYISQTEGRSLLGCPSLILSKFRRRQWSFLSYIPARYGHSQCCDDAVQCVAAACHSIVINNNPRSLGVLSLYNRALKSVQSAIYDSEERLKPDTLCAVHILAFYELLNMATEEDVRWRRHVLGAASLIEARGPEQFQTGFEINLLLAQVGPLFTEAITDTSYCSFEGDAISLQSAIVQRLRPMDGGPGSVNQVPRSTVIMMNGKDNEHHG
ncbi:hypothetical protein FH972_023639 [Carpinus fangiana]|uniref:Uncharacterized protein n=1 Tax=Carpinus fangiana TaxID=176857 RepID=A0A5N6KW98_9ROSI|nr:hypothetical protein FH972_023639 [Carpinus fangiana]